MTHGKITAVSYVDGAGPWLRCACAECSRPWRAHVLRAVLPSHGVTAYVDGDMLDLAKTLEAP